MSNVTPEMIEAACEAMAIKVAQQDGVELTKAGYRHGAETRPDEHEQMREYVRDAITAALALIPVEPIGEAGPMPGSNGGFTMAAFKADDVPIGTKLYSAPHLSLDREGLLEEARKTLADLVQGLVTDDEEGLIEHVPQIVAARAFLSKLEGSSHAKD
ncbi:MULTISPECIES: hypothetical protein [unclassified Rhizobium]|uniref:hypothetical protein n=1 Tax=unclassified Rhizobium TaxID=2613769 RepID=UPI003805E40A